MRGLRRRMKNRRIEGRKRKEKTEERNAGKAS